MDLKSKPYHFLGIFGFAFIMLSFIFKKGSTIDIHLHDTVFIIAAAHIVLICAFILLSLWLIYSFTFNIGLFKILFRIHIAYTISYFAFLIVMTWVESLPPEQGSYHESYKTLNVIAGYATLIFILTQILFVLNIFTGLIKKLFVKT